MFLLVASTCYVLGDQDDCSHCITSNIQKKRFGYVPSKIKCSAFYCKPLHYTCLNTVLPFFVGFSVHYEVVVALGQCISFLPFPTFFSQYGSHTRLSIRFFTIQYLKLIWPSDFSQFFLKKSYDFC
jgi:hypothetical protein